MATRKTASKTTTNRKKLTPEQEAAQKEKLIADLKDTLKEAGRIPGLIFAPVVAFIAKKYDTIPEERRKGLDDVIAKIKKGGKGGLDSLKERFTSAREKATKSTTTASKAQTKPKAKPTRTRAPAKKKATTTARKTPAKKTRSPAKKTSTKTKTTTTKKTTTRKASS